MSFFNFFKKKNPKQEIVECPQEYIYVEGENDIEKLYAQFEKWMDGFLYDTFLSKQQWKYIGYESVGAFVFYVVKQHLMADNMWGVEVRPEYGFDLDAYESEQPTDTCFDQFFWQQDGDRDGIISVLTQVLKRYMSEGKYAKVMLHKDDSLQPYVNSNFEGVGILFWNEEELIVVK